MKVVKTVFVTGVVLLALFFTYIILPGPNKHNKKLYFGSSSKFAIATVLEEKNIIRNKYLFWVASQLLRTMGPMQAGEYLFSEFISPIHIILKMQAGDVVEYKITIPEGLYNSEIIKIINNDPNLHGNITKNFSQGVFFPSTYYFNYGYSKMDLLTKMEKKMEEVINALWLERKKSLPFKTKQQANILASIVEKETEHDDERSRIAAVFINRLKKGMKLQADPTTIYAITRGKYKLEQELTRKDLLLNSPYNTYFAKGLPPGPICNPGYASIKAVLQPSDSNELYFVLNPDGRHNFASNYKAHLSNVRIYYRSKDKA